MKFATWAIKSEWTVYNLIKLKIMKYKIGYAAAVVSAVIFSLSLSSCAKKLAEVDPTTPTDSLKVGLIAYYPFNNNANDESGNGNNGTATNVTSATDRNGNTNAAAQFDGTSSYVTVNDNTGLRLNATDFTINYWVNLDQYSSLSGSAILSKNNGPHQNGWNCSVTGTGNVDPGTGNGNYGHAFYNVSGGGDPYAIGNAVMATAHWNMVTVVYTLSQHKIAFYVNGVLDNIASDIPTPNGETNVKLLIGKNSLNDGVTPLYYLKGKLDDIRIYDRALSTNLINKLYIATN
jgi:Concanavalin A-like lectin/glucanases superfamily